MALIKCRECGKEISDEAKMCPNCGAITKRQKRKNEIIFALCFLVLFIVGVAILSKVTSDMVPTADKLYR